MTGVGLALLGAVAVLVMGVALVAWYGADQLVQRRRPDLPATPADYGLRYEAVSFTARDGLPLQGYWMPAPGDLPDAPPSAPAIVLCHGYNGSLDADLKTAPLLNRAGFGVLAFDFRAHGRSDGHLVSLGYHERQDLLGAVDWLQKRGVSRVGVLGFSMGGAVALSAAPLHPLIHVVVADGAFAEVRTLIEGGLRERYKTGPLTPWLAWAMLQAIGWRVAANVAQADPLRVIGELAPRAVLLIHGAQDPYVPMDSIRALYRAARPPKALWVVPEAGHREAAQLRPQEYERRVVDFFKTYLN